VSNTRSVHTDALATLGTAPLGAEARRDAIHIAVEPVVAGERLHPGAHITVVKGVAYNADTEDEEPPLGIVDPFLTKPIRKGQRFWFLMYPRMVTSLRHVWAHPSFPDEEGTPAEVPAVDHSPAAQVDRVIEARAKSERWLRDYIANSDFSGWSYEEVLEVAHGGVAGAKDANGDPEYGSISHKGTYVYTYGSDSHGAIPDEFWDHVEVVTGKRVAHRAEYFSCSC
jgi:hypothetical protein